MNYSEENNLQPNSSFEKLFPYLFSNENSLSSKSEETGEQGPTTHELKRKFDQLCNKPSNLPGIKKVKQLQMTYEFMAFLGLFNDIEKEEPNDKTED